MKVQTLRFDSTDAAICSGDEMCAPVVLWKVTQQKVTQQEVTQQEVPVI